MAASDAALIAIKNATYRVTFPIFDADGDLVDTAAGLDSEVSKDAGAWADCTNEATEIGTSGIYYLDLIDSEMNADTVAVIVKTSTSGAKTTPIVIYTSSADIEDVHSDTTVIASDLLLVHSETTAIQTDTGNIYSDTTIIEAWGLSADAFWDEVMDTNAPAACNTAREYMNIFAAALAGVSAGTGDWSARDLGNTKTRLEGTLSSEGVRNSIDTLDGT